ncbi:putative feruloyl esterase [Dactylonectria estremocensis]|uniref:Carboxylic ester hydrolase n=1 Tax=Dactylonectria estremocensis TaxID=1079267 RepID=A0A9P9IIC3_9HYPO|nr:putative feruloyl esterase [Dactylonectria estremocensis]
MLGSISFVVSSLVVAALADFEKPLLSEVPYSPQRSCASLTASDIDIDIPGASVLSFSAAEVANYDIPNGPTFGFCDVNVTLTHNTAGDKVRVQVWLPLDINDWNGRFQATGGGGFVAGIFSRMLGPAVASGYAAASTDAGLSASDGSELMANPQLMINFASLSLHEMAVVGKAVTEWFYGKPAEYSYWNGLSTGGRQGMMEAQKYPDDFDGILALAPAINWDRFMPTELYPYVVMTQEGEIVPACVFDALREYAIAFCDADDGAEDGFISDPQSCKFDANSAVDKPTHCKDDSYAAVSSRQARIYNLIVDGFIAQNGTRLWYGLMHGTDFALLTHIPPFAKRWALDFVLEQPDLDPATITYAMLEDIFVKSQAKWNSVIGTDDPDLTALRDHGGKILTWHGLSDPLIFPEGTLDYRRKVEAKFGGSSAVDDFYRVFSAPGVAHGRGGYGPYPEKALDALVAWVEDGDAPDTLLATITTDGVTTERNLCRYPFTLRYLGNGPINEASSWTCVANNGVPLE